MIILLRYIEVYFLHKVGQDVHSMNVLLAPKHIAVNPTKTNPYAEKIGVNISQ